LSASREVAAAVGRELGCSVVTREEVVEHARQYGVAETGLAGVDLMAMQPPHVWDRHAAQRRMYLTLLRASLMDLIAGGNVIYMGHMGQFVLANVPKVLRIRVDSSLEYRVGALTEGSKLSEDEARDYIQKIDERRRKWAKFLYGVEYDNPLNYDIIVNLERLSLTSAAEIIACAVRRREWQLDGATMQEIQDLRLAAVVQARLAGSPRTRGMELAVVTDSRTGSVTIKGKSTLIGARTWQDDIRETVMEMKGIRTVDVVDLR